MVPMLLYTKVLLSRMVRAKIQESFSMLLWRERCR